jgi:thiamine monophosphate kinase
LRAASSRRRPRARVTHRHAGRGRHFLPGADPEALGHKALAVNLSDLAAMGAAPRWTTLALALPAADERWLAGFARGFFALADRFGVDLVVATRRAARSSPSASRRWGKCLRG